MDSRIFALSIVASRHLALDYKSWIFIPSLCRVWRLSILQLLTPEF
jgi:hypothetical protein